MVGHSRMQFKLSDKDEEMDWYQYTQKHICYYRIEKSSISMTQLVKSALIAKLQVFPPILEKKMPAGFLGY